VESGGGGRANGRRDVHGRPSGEEGGRGGDFGYLPNRFERKDFLASGKDQGARGGLLVFLGGRGKG